MKDLFRETDIVRSITDIQFSVFSPEQIQQLSHVEIVNTALYEAIEGNEREPAKYGILDKRLGVNQKDSVCGTCKKGLLECVGHFGHIELPRPTFHIGFFRFILKILQNICKSCARVLLKPEVKKAYLHKFRKTESYVKKKQNFHTLNEKCKKVSVCPYCNEVNGKVKKAYLQLVYEKMQALKKGDRRIFEYQELFSVAKENNKNVADSMPVKAFEFLDPAEVLSLFKRIPTEDVKLLCINTEFGHPKDLLMTKVLVSPSCIRPSVVSDFRKGMNEDDITAFYGLLLFFKMPLEGHRPVPLESYANNAACLQFMSAAMINSQLTVPPSVNDNCRKMIPKQGFVQRLKGKQGRFRGNLSGKRVDFSSRTVISPDPNLRIDEVGVPVEVAKLLTYPERVTPHNIKLLRELVKNGPDVHPGAIYVELRKMPGMKKALQYMQRDRQASDLKYGDVVQRHLMDGDIVLFNRQPSLHKMSIMSHRAKVLPWRTFRFNECVCTPYNADFDGDEMNLHLPQTEEARAEANILMGVKSNLVTPRHGALIIGATQDFITSSFLLTQKSEFFDREHTSTLISSILTGKDSINRIDLPPPAIMKPIELWTGKQIFSVLLRPHKDYPVKCNMLVTKKNGNRNETLCSNDCCVVIRNSELLVGSLDKSLIGSGNKQNVFYVILKDYGKDYAADVMWRVARISSYYLSNRGFSIGIGDVMPHRNLITQKEVLLDKGYDECNKLIEQFKEGNLTCLPGLSLEETLENSILKELSTIRKTLNVEELLSNTNAARIMSVSGSKGSNLNISQMIACVGQQAINGKRVPNGFQERALPHYEKFSKVPEAKGFVSNSFFSGLTPTEFIFHTMAGREGLVDTAVKTADTGYMQRRLVKSLEDLFVGYDMTVRNSSQDVIQFRYGGDGLDPTEMEGELKPIDFQRLLIHVKAKDPDPIEEVALSRSDIKTFSKKYLGETVFSDLEQDFKDDIIKFLIEYGDKIEKIRSRNKVDFIERLTFNQLTNFINACADRYHGAVIEPGTAVGALCAQSIGEPGTQMTLKTFHFAGVATMNITQGVPRIKEIINASKKISTPVVKAVLTCDNVLEKARQVKGRIEKTLLGEVCEYLEEVFLPDDCFLLLKLAMDRIRLLKLEVDANSIKYNICCSKKLKVKESEVEVKSETIILVRPKSKDSSIYYQLQHLKQHITDVVIKGLPSVNRAIISQDDQSKDPKYTLLVEGNNLREVIATYGVDGTKCTSNNTLEVFETLGIEAAKATIIREITYTMSSHGLTVDHRHIMLLADLMTCQGQVRGITRFGLEKTKESVLTLASYEKTADHLFDAAYYGQKNPIKGVSDCIILGKPMNIGTGVFKLLHKHEKKLSLQRRGLIFDHPEFHLPLPDATYA